MSGTPNEFGLTCVMLIGYVRVRFRGFFPMKLRGVLMMAIACWSFLAVAAETADVPSIATLGVPCYDFPIALVNRLMRKAFVLWERAGWTPARVDRSVRSPLLHSDFESGVLDHHTAHRFRDYCRITKGIFPNFGLSESRVNRHPYEWNPMRMYNHITPGSIPSGGSIIADRQSQVRL